MDGFGIFSAAASLGALRPLLKAYWRSMGLYNVLDYGIKTGTTSANAASNTTALTALWATMGADAAAHGQGAIAFFPAGHFPFNPGVLLNHGMNTTLRGLSIQGSGQSTIIDLYGTTGPWWSFATTVANAMQGCFVRDLRFQHQALPTGGATIALGQVGDFTLENLYMTKNGNIASLFCLDISAPIATSNIWIQDCSFTTRDDTATLVAGGLFPTNIRVLNATGFAGGGLFLRRTDLSGCQTRSIGLDFVNVGSWDTVEIIGGLIKDHEIGIRKITNVGYVSNFSANGLKIDGITGTSVQVAPPTSSACTTWQFTGCWFSANGSHLSFDQSLGGTFSGLIVTGCYMSTTATGAPSVPSIVVGAGVDIVNLSGNYVNAALVNTVGVFSVDIGAAAGAVLDVTVVGNWISCGASAGGALRISTAVVPFSVGLNTLRGVAASIPADNGTTKRQSLNAFQA